MKIRRFKVPSLENVAVGASVELPLEQARHARVLRLEASTLVEIFDEEGRAAQGTLSDTQGITSVLIQSLCAEKIQRVKLTLAVPWPKGKRAALLVEKCTELEVDRLIPLHCERSVVSKDDESEGVVRLRRIASEAAKQCGRSKTPDIQTEQSLQEVVENLDDSTCAFVLDPKSELWLTTAIEDVSHSERHSNTPIKGVLLLIGPEGGFSSTETETLAKSGIIGVRVAQYVLRIETAALAGCAIARAALAQFSS